MTPDREDDLDLKYAAEETTRPPNRPVLRLLFWESTARCNLSCAHCRRTETRPARADELSTAQARRLMDSAAQLGRPIFVFSGGEPLLRGDWETLAHHAHRLGLPIALATNGTLIDAALARRIAAADFERVSVSLDAAEPAGHDGIRGTPGAYRRALAGIAALRDAGVAVQINTTVVKANIERLPELYDLARRLGAVALHVFLLVPVGCGMDIPPEHMPTPAQCERALQWIVETIAAEGGIELKATCAPQFQRLARQWLARNQHAPGAQRVRAAIRSRGCLAGRAVLFVSHAGEVFPCGYLPVSCGSVLHRPLAEIWTHCPVLQALRDETALGGKCGRCEYRSVCGGCRARAFAHSGDYLAEAPWCPHQPGSAT